MGEGLQGDTHLDSAAVDQVHHGLQINRGLLGPEAVGDVQKRPLKAHLNSLHQFCWLIPIQAATVVNRSVKGVATVAVCPTP